MLENDLIVFFAVEQWLNSLNNLRVQRNVGRHPNLVLDWFDKEHRFLTL
jgi:hypothetical protein